MITLKNFVFNELSVNSFVLSDLTGECVIVDPGCNSDKQKAELTEYIKNKKLTPVSIINTHGHFDHIFGNSFVKSLYQCPVLLHKDDSPLIEDADKYAGIFGFYIERPPLPDGYLQDGEEYLFGESVLKIIHCPGHSPGSICLYSENDGFLIGGDVLFNGSIGRTDMPGGNFHLLISGIKQKLMILPAQTVVWPGHGSTTTINAEHDTNPFLR